MIGPALERLCASQGTERAWQGSTRGGKDKGSFVSLVNSSITSSKIRKSRHLRKFQTMISSSMRKLHYGPLWHCGEPTFTWTVAAWRLHTPFSLGITVVLSLYAYATQTACCRIDCKVALNWSVAPSHTHVLYAWLFITWTTLIRTAQMIVWP